MPTPQSVSVCNINALTTPPNAILSEDMCLQLLRKKECLAYHHVCGVFRAQGHLTPEKLKLLKEVQSILSISDVRHRAECRIAVNNGQLNMIAECVAGPDTDVEWRREAQEERFSEPEERVNSASLQMADALAKVIYESLNSATENKTISKTVNLKSLWSGDVVNNGETEHSHPSEKPNTESKEEVPILLKSEDEIKEEDKDGELSSSVSSTSELPEEPQSPGEFDKEKVKEAEREIKPDSDAVLMPPPPVSIASPSPVSADPPTSPVITIPPPTPAPVVSLPTSPNVITVPPSSSISTLPPSPAVITVPPSSSILALSPPHPAVITVPPPMSLPNFSATDVPLTISTPSPSVIPTPSELLTTQPLPSTCEINECTPVLSEDMQFVSFSESIDSSLPSLVVVPPPEPVITVPHSSSFSPTPPAPTLVLPSGMSIQLREEIEDSKKRKRTLSQDGSTSNGSSAPSSKTMAFSHISKMTPVMVSVANMSAAGLKVTPTISRAKMAVTTQGNLTSSTQKVIIVSNTSSSNAPVIQRSLNVPMGVPYIRATQPRLQTTPVSGGLAKVRPKMVTVPAKCRPKSSPMMIPVSGHNLQLKNTFTIKQDNVTVVDSCGKKVPLGPTTPAKILPKPQTSMFIMNTSQGPQKITTPMSLHAGSQSTRMLSPRVVDGPGSKQNVVILQKGGGKTQRVTLTNTSKDLVQKLMSKKCVVIQSSKSLPKTISPKPPPPSPSVPTSTANNVVVLDLSQEQYRQNLSNTTLAEILQASGILAATSATPSVTSASPLSTSVAAPEPSNNWLSVEASKNLALEEVTLPLGQSESVVTLDQAVELLGETVEQPASTVIEVESQGNISDSSDQIFSITPEELAAGSVTFMTESIAADNSSSSQVLVDSLSDELQGHGDAVSHCYPNHRDGAVTIQHSNIDMPANMSLEEYSSQQMENQGLN